MINSGYFISKSIIILLPSWRMKDKALPVRKEFRVTKFDLYGSTKAASTVC
jgi:hypothetical protein